MIDIVGHFGSRLSYATVSEQLARGLREAGVLGIVTNLDDKFATEEFATTAPRQRGQAVIMISDVRDYLVEMLAGEYGRKNVAVFVCPNTNQLSSERVHACRDAGRVYTPSEWCTTTVFDAYFRSRRRGEIPPLDVLDIHTMPLGVDEPFATKWVDRPGRAEKLRLLHVTTDTWWPGRKGTEELLLAWKRLRETRDAAYWATLTIHCLPQIYASIVQELGDHDLIDHVKLVSSETRGTTPDELFDLFAAHDLLVAPSRSEGFGIMPLSALVSGTPVLTTCNTGQHEYLGEQQMGEGILGGWAPIVTSGAAVMAGEDGDAPLVRPDLLAYAIESAWQHGSYDQLRDSVRRNALVQTQWSWKARREAWVRNLIEWATKTNKESA